MLGIVKKTVKVSNFWILSVNEKPIVLLSPVDSVFMSVSKCE